MAMADADDDMPRLSSHALAALREFMAESDLIHHRPGAAKDRLPDETEEEEDSRCVLPEDWRLSQFWYDPRTSFVVSQELEHLSKALDSPVACISCPSLYVELKKTFTTKVRLYEYDKRFQSYGNDYTYYDYNTPEDVPEEHHHTFRVVVADPPYLSKECIEKTAQTMKLLAKDEQSCLLLLTGAVQLDHARDLLGAHPCGFRPTHHNKLGNEFMLFTNYDPQERLGGWENPKI